ncbi:hypothetical protein BD310DRAFT_1042143 [Dichomitus squalens]|uniref:DUF6534 domain-containing protein n=1 Tax=Dichomitus squalens TaxID=114155 RepID=A0A4Q9PI73_9APHY|nr:hypothetical protein BD310DRAFT_1042143 [Dichomitus squalens]
MSSNATSTVLTSLPSLPSLNNTFGAVLIGTFLGLILYGVTVQQTTTYFRVYTADAFLMKFMIFCLALLDAGNAVVTIHVCYYYLVTNYFNPFALLDGVWSIRMLPILMTTTLVIAQLFYIRRVYLLGSGYRYVAIVAAICTIGAVGFGTVFSVECFKRTTFFEFNKFTWIGSGAFGCAVAADALLTTALIIFLRCRSTSFQRTKSMLSVLIVYTINTGLFTSALNLLTLVTAALHMNNMIYIAATILAMRSYVIAVLTVVNSRRSLIGSAREESDFGTFGLGASQKHSVRIPARLEHFRAPRSEGEVIGISSWKAPADAGVKHATQSQDGDDVISREDV